MDKRLLFAAALAIGLMATTTSLAFDSQDVDPVTGAGDDFMISLPGDSDWEPSAAYNPHDDQYLVVWEDKRPGTNEADIYGQVVSASGIPLRDNVVIAVAADNQLDPAVAYNTTNRTYLVIWQDLRGGVDTDVYGQFIEATGVLSGTNFALNTDNGHQIDPDVIYDPSTNHYLAVWDDTEADQIEGQLLDPSGVLLAPEGFAIAPGGSTPRAAYNSNRSSYMVVYWDSGDILGQAVAADGSLSGSAFVISDEPASKTEPDLAFNAITHDYLVVWRDWRNAPPSLHTDIYAQRIDEDGNTQGDEIVISTAADTQEKPQVAYVAQVNQWLVIWQDFRNRETSGSDIYGQRVRGADGSLAGQGNFVIHNGPGDQWTAALAAQSRAGGAEYLVVWEDWRSGRQSEIIGQRVGALLGTLNWHDFNISAPLGSQRNPRVSYNSVDERFLVAWQDERDGDLDIYAQLILTTGIPMSDTIVVRDELGELTDPIVAHDPYTNAYLVAWDDETEGDIEGILLDGSGGAAGSAFNISDGVDVRRNPAIAFSPDDSHYLVAFEYQTLDGTDIYGRRLAADGSRPGTDFPLCTAVGDQVEPNVVYNNYDDVYLVVWGDERADQGDIYGARVLVNETVLTEFPISTASDAQAHGAAAWNSDDNEYLIVWHDYRDSGTTGADIYAQRLGNTGTPLGSALRLSSSTLPDLQMYPRVQYVSDHGRYVVTWQDDRNAPTGWDIYVQNVNADGSLYGTNVPFFAFSGWQQRPDAAFSPDANGGLTVWQDGRNGTTFKIYGRIKEPRFAIFMPLVLRTS